MFYSSNALPCTVLPYGRKQWWDKTLANLDYLDYLEEKSSVNGLQICIMQTLKIP